MQDEELRRILAANMRKARGSVSQRELAERMLACGLEGVKSLTLQQSISRWESGSVLPTVSHIVAFATACGVPPGFLLCEGANAHPRRDAALLALQHLYAASGALRTVDIPWASNTARELGILIDRARRGVNHLVHLPEDA